MRGPAALTIAGIASIAACTQFRADAFEREATRVESALTTPAGTRLLERGVESRNALQVAQSWQAHAAGDWVRYAEEVHAAMAGLYSCSRVGTSLLCSRSLRGDVFRLEVVASADAKGLIIRAQLLGLPD